MNDDLKAYVDGELPPDAAERLRASLAVDPALAFEGEEFRRLSAALRSLPEPAPVGQAETLAAIARRRPLWRGWTFALAGSAAVLALVSTLPTHMIVEPRAVSAAYESGVSNPVGGFANGAPEPSIPASQLQAFEKSVQSRGGSTSPEGDGVRAKYPKSVHEDVMRHYGSSPKKIPWKADGIRFRVGK